MPQLISNHGMRMVEAALVASEMEELELRVYDLSEVSKDELTQDLLTFDPDVLGFSAYLWSFPFFIEVATLLKLDDPRRLVVFGGPSARPSMMNLSPYRNAKPFIDALVINEGELTFLEIVALRNRSEAALRQISGLALPTEDGWFKTPPRPLGDLNSLPSPYRLGLVPRGGLGVLQTYRGCPFTCSFCEWGTLESPKRVRSVDGLCGEFESMDRAEVHGALLVDAGLNLNHHAFRNLGEAAAQTKFFADRHFICEVYPAKIQDEHLDFLANVGRPLVGMGLQSFDNDVLAHVERSYDEVRFEEHLRRLTEIAGVAVEIILGLPGDNPDNFRRSFERARTLPCALRVYHCVVLPSALMIRAPANYDMAFDPVTLKMRSCLGWTATDLQREIDFVTREAEAQGGRSGQFFWIFPPPGTLY
ncbi:MAG: radical SAM protein [Planctomycetaceae bacterium]|nr:radical SAM protein [Planctomycetaceae bacterium]